uniref:Uncharacterized protein n=1 Tax=Candidatus Methanophagaceae archaeon ANME-1 ERB6 TaxID=2759912 RepID=A0A7G9YZ43_9EURY|nr:hypothetical protein OJOIIACA_00001 [Methanosarcinales archaeon ANME-1 ERB6]
MSAALFKVFHYGVVVGEITIVNESFMHSHEWVSTTGMPYPAPCGITLMRYPDMSSEILKFIISYYVLCITNDLQYHHIPAVREHKRPLFAERSVELRIDFEAILIDELVFCPSSVYIRQFIFSYELIKHILLNPNKIPPYIRWFCI